MPWTKPKACHGSCFLVWRYLTRGRDGTDRAVAADYRNIADEAAWWRQMDQTRAAFGHDLPTRRGRARSYSHYVIAPDPRDFEGIGRDEGLRRVRALACGWVDRYLEDYEVAIVYHDDGDNGNIHAHIVANVTNLRTGMKRQEGRADWERAKATVDELAREVGLRALADRIEETEAEVGSILDDLNREREGRGEAPVARNASRAVSTTQEEVLTQAERHMRGRLQRTRKDDVRAAANRAAYLSDSFDSFRAALRRDGYDVYQNRRGNLVYVHRDGQHRFRDVRLGAMWQSDLLATEFMDLRFTRSTWRARRGEYELLESDGIRVPRVSARSVNDALDAWTAHHVSSVGEAADAVARMRANALEAASRLDRYESARAALSADMSDRELVDRAAPVVEQWREGGRISDSCPQPREVVAAYEAARKRLARRRHETDLRSLRELVDAYSAAAADDRRTVEGIRTEAESLMRATSVLKSVTDHVEAGRSRERTLYGWRLEEAEEAAVAGGAARRSRGTVNVRGKAALGAIRLPSPADTPANARRWRRELDRAIRAAEAMRATGTQAPGADRERDDTVAEPPRRDPGQADRPAGATERTDGAGTTTRDEGGEVKAARG